MNLRWAVAASIMLHALVLLSWAGTVRTEDPQHKPTLSAPQITLLPPVSSGIGAKKIAKSTESDPLICSGRKKSYEGVGFMYSPTTHMIVSLPTYYPAFKGGLGLGDEIVYMDQKPNSDGLRKFIIRRYTKELTMYLRNELICFNTDEGKERR